MARNKVQYQKGLSEAEFERRYGSEEQCRAAVAKWRWPDGFVCPRCGGRRHSLIKTRALYQCTACRRQTSLTAGTIFAATKLALRSWFRALYHLTQSKQGISSLELGRRLGVTQTTAWTVKHKLKQVMMERDAKKRLIGRVEMDDAYLGGQRSGGKRGRGAAGKTPIVATVETTAEGRPVRLKLRRVRGFRRSEIEAFAKRSLDAGCTVVSDGLSCFRGVTAAGCTHQPIRTGSGRKAVLAPAFKWVNTALGNIKTAIVGTYRAIRDKHVPRYLAEFEYRFNRRYDLAAMLPRLGWAAVRTRQCPTASSNWLKLMRKQVRFCLLRIFPSVPRRECRETMSGESSASRGSRKVRAKPCTLAHSHADGYLCHAHAFISTDGPRQRAEQDFAGDLARTTQIFFGQEAVQRHQLRSARA